MNKKAILILIIFLSVFGLVYGATGDTLTIGGSVPLILELTVSPDPNADDLTLVGAAAPATATIATIGIVTNSSAGWELWVQSTNATTYASLINADGDEIPYTLGYTTTTGDGNTTNAGSAITSDGIMLGEDDDVSTVEEGNLDITYAQAPDYPAGYYSDLLTITIRAK
jgi:hypothetical protein